MKSYLKNRDDIWSIPLHSSYQGKAEIFPYYSLIISAKNLRSDATGSEAKLGNIKSLSGRKMTDVTSNFG